MIGNALEWLGAAGLVMLLTAFEVVAYFAPIALELAEAVLLYLIYKAVRRGNP